ncbi:MAG: hypothetical protein V9G14_14505 [Cypionkella sp.]
MPVPDRLRANVRDGQAVMLGIRPDDIMPGGPRPARRTAPAAERATDR